MSDKQKRSIPVISASAKQPLSTPTRPRPTVRQNSAFSGDVKLTLSPRSATTPSSNNLPSNLTTHHAQSTKARYHTLSSSSIPIPSPGSGAGSASRIPRKPNCKRAEQFKTLSEPLVIPKQDACHSCGVGFVDPNERISLTDVSSKVLYHFHRNHISCCKCHVAIDPSQPMMCKDGAVYCQTHWPHNRVCHECNEPIIGGSLKAANDQYYHREHLRCYECKVSLYEENGEKEHYPYKDRLYCQTHRQKVEVECAGCKQKGPWDSMIPSKNDGPMYHSDCIKCWVCSAANCSLFVSNNRLYCARDFDSLVNRRCSECGDCIRIQQGQSLIAGNNNSEFYHTECLKCEICQVELTDYLSKNGHLRCGNHAHILAKVATCDGCHNEIDESCLVKSMGRKWHRSCFNCSFCRDPVDEATCTLKDDKIACQLCFTDQTLAETKRDTISQLNAMAPARPPRPLSTGNQAFIQPSKPMHVSSPPISLTMFSAPTKAPPPLPKKRLSISASASSSTVPSPRSNNRSPSSVDYSAIEQGHSHSTSVDMMTSSSIPSPSSRTETSTAQDDVTLARLASMLINPSTSRTTQTVIDAATSNNQSINQSIKQPVDDPSSTASEELAAPPVLKGNLGKVIGKGGCATVRLATDINDNKLAVKIMKSADVDTGFENEVELMRSLRHPHIVSFLGTRKFHDEWHIYMEYIDGVSLHQQIKSRGPLDEASIKIYLKQLLQALAYCHARGVIHRDIKGKNVLVDKTGAKLCDFGSAKKFALDETSANPTMNYGFTPLWLAPEYVSDKYNNKADIWSLACVVIEMASGKDPWDEKKFPNPFAAIFHIGTKKDIPAIPHTLSEEGQKFVRSMLAFDPRQRPSAAELLNSPYLNPDACKAIPTTCNGPPVTPSKPNINVSSLVQSPAARQALSFPTSSPAASPIATPTVHRQPKTPESLAKLQSQLQSWNSNRFHSREVSQPAPVLPLGEHDDIHTSVEARPTITPMTHHARVPSRSFVSLHTRVPSHSHSRVPSNHNLTLTSSNPSHPFHQRENSMHLPSSITSIQTIINSTATSGFRQ